MKNILDFDENNKFVDHLSVETHELEEVVDLLKKNHIRHRVREVKHSEDVHAMTPQKINLSAANYVIQVPINSKIKVDDLVKQNIESLGDSTEVRRLFLSKTMDEEGLVDILLFPEEWMEGDSELVVEILANKGIRIPKSEYQLRRSEREIKRSHKRYNDNWKTNMKSFLVAVLLFWVMVVLWLLS